MLVNNSSYFVYLIRCKDNSLYCGITKDLKKRLLQHNSGKGSKFLRAKGGGKLAYQETQPDRSTALIREAEIKRMTKVQKEQLTNK